MKRKSIWYIVITTVIILILLLICYLLSGKEKVQIESIVQDDETINDVTTEIMYDESEEGYFSNFYEDGTLLAEGVSSGEFFEFVVYSKEGKILGTGDGKIVEDCDISNECITYNMVNNGIDVRFYDDESIQMISKMKNGEPVNSIYYSRDGTFMGELEYRKGFPYSGAEYYFFDNGQIEAETHYKRGKMDGHHYEYYKSGELMIDALLNNGKSIRRDTYDENGNKIDRIY